MSLKPIAWRPAYTITPNAARLLVAIEATRAAVEHTHLPPTVEAELRREARVRATHDSTRIEGNRLTLAEAEKAISQPRAEFHGRQRDVREAALVLLNQWVKDGSLLVAEPSRRKRAYELTVIYRQYIGKSSAMGAGPSRKDKGRH
jgi:hypothetical protein